MHYDFFVENWTLKSNVLPLKIILSSFPRVFWFCWYGHCWLSLCPGSVWGANLGSSRVFSESVPSLGRYDDFLIFPIYIKFPSMSGSQKEGGAITMDATSLYFCDQKQEPTVRAQFPNIRRTGSFWASWVPQAIHRLSQEHVHSWLL